VVQQVRKAPKKGTALRGRDAFPGAICPHSINSGVRGSAPITLVGEQRPCFQSPDEKKQLFHRLPRDVVEATLAAFNDGRLSPSDACVRLGVGRSRLYTLRTVWLAGGRRLPLAPSGGDHTATWPEEADRFLRTTLAMGEAANFSFLADELCRRFGFKRSVSNVREHVRTRMPELLREPLKRGPKPRRRWQRKGYGDLLQHDSSPHQWWPGDKLQILALTIDDATRFIVGASFIEAETTFAHLAHVREIFTAHGLPNDFYTDGLSLFGHESRKAGDTDTLSQFQRALGCLGVNHLVAKDPQSKGKIERQFGFWQKRLPALMRVESVRTRAEANELLAAQIDWHHRHHRSRSTGMTPCQAVAESIREGSSRWRPAPAPELLDLHLAVHHTRVVQKAGEISFLGRRWEITPGNTKQVTIVQQPESFRVIAHPPTPQRPQWPDILAEYCY
jgi:hypothetical protein